MGQVRIRAVWCKATENRNIAGRENKRYGFRLVDRRGRQLVVLPILRRQRTAGVIAGIYNSAAIITISVIKGNQDGQETPRKALPRDPILVQPISFYAGRLKNELVFE